MTKKILVVLSMAVVFFLAPAWAQAAEVFVFTVNSKSYLADGQAKTMDVAPYIKDGRTYLPVRYAALAAGINEDGITWNGADSTVLLNSGKKTIKLAVGSTTMHIYGIPFSMDAAPEIKDGRVMLPVRYVALAMNMNISWNETRQSVTLSKGMPAGLLTGRHDKVVPPLTYPASTETISKDFFWQYKNINYSFQIEIPVDLLNYNKNIQSACNKYFDMKNGYEQYIYLSTLPQELQELTLAQTILQNGNFVPWVKENINYLFAGFVAERLAARAAADGYDYYHTAEFVLSFVNSAIPYKTSDFLSLPGQTLVDNGDCKCKSVLLAALLDNLGYDVVLLKYPTHEAVGVSFADNQIPGTKDLAYYSYNGKKYYFCETTTAGWTIGELSDEDSVKTAYVYQID